MTKMSFEEAKADAESKAKQMTREQLENYFVIYQACQNSFEDDEIEELK